MHPYAQALRRLAGNIAQGKQITGTGADMHRAPTAYLDLMSGKYGTDLISIAKTNNGAISFLASMRAFETDASSKEHNSAIAAMIAHGGAIIHMPTIFIIGTFKLDRGDTLPRWRQVALYSWALITHQTPDPTMWKVCRDALCNGGNGISAPLIRLAIFVVLTAGTIKSNKRKSFPVDVGARKHANTLCTDVWSPHTVNGRKLIRRIFNSPACIGLLKTGGGGGCHAWESLEDALLRDYSRK